MFALTLTEDSSYICSLGKGYFFKLDALGQDRFNASAVLYSACCRKPLESSFWLLPDPGAREEFLCSNCFRSTPAPLKEFTLTDSSSTWRLGEPELLQLLLERISDPLSAEVSYSILQELIVRLMNTASALYACLPEGNLRGSEPLNHAVKARLAEEVLLKVCGLETLAEEVVFSEYSL